nr:Rhamnogalacturonide transporter RhiT [Raoultella sp. NCTC 9187]
MTPAPISSTGWCLRCCLCSACFISWKVTWERELTPEMQAELESKAVEKTFAEKMRSFGHLFKEYASTLKVRAFRKHLAIYLFSFTAKRCL